MTLGVNVIGWLGLENGRVFWDESGLSGDDFYDVLYTASVDDPTPLGLVTLSSTLRNAVADDTNVYFSLDSSTMPLARVDLAGGTASALTPAWGNTWVGIDATNVYFTDQGIEEPTNLDDPNVAHCELRSMPIGGGSVTTLFVGDRGDAINGCDPIAFRVYAGHAVWMYAEADGTISLMQVPVTGGSATTLATNVAGDAGWFALDDRFVYYLADASSPMDLMKVPLDGGTPTLERTLAPAPFSIAIDADHVYWSSAEQADSAGNVTDPGSIYMAPK
ncbi:MAG TPA: hypothetical protein VMH39_14600 [Gemmatimonadaceae bacterium]|nr:hypothetical protein [Gemmatimonadaceae bacterium]